MLLTAVADVGDVVACLDFVAVVVVTAAVVVVLPLLLL